MYSSALGEQSGFYLEIVQRASPKDSLEVKAVDHSYGWVNGVHIIYSCVEKNKHVCGGQAISTKTLYLVFTGGV